MTTETESLGRFLREGRETAGLRLEDIAVRTKIARLTLEHLEAERFSDLPPRVFVLGFVRAYAKTAGLCEETAVALFRKQLGTAGDTTLAFVCPEPEAGETAAPIGTDSSWDAPLFRMKDFFRRPEPSDRSDATQKFGVDATSAIAPLPAEKTDLVANNKPGFAEKSDRMEVVMVVLLILVVATITLSLLLKSSNRSTGGLSQNTPEVRQSSECPISVGRT